MTAERSLMEERFHELEPEGGGHANNRNVIAAASSSVHPKIEATVFPYLYSVCAGTRYFSRMICI
jgi:hypothetical protein